MRNSARGIIIRDGKVLVMFRRKIENGTKREYYVIPGGGIEGNELPKQTVVRELKEEMNVDATVLGLLGTGDTKSGLAYYFMCEIPNDQTPKLGGEELDKVCEENYYEPMFVDISAIDKLDLIGKEFVYLAVKKEFVKEN